MSCSLLFSLSPARNIQLLATSPYHIQALLHHHHVSNIEIGSLGHCPVMVRTIILAMQSNKARVSCYCHLELRGTFVFLYLSLPLLTLTPSHATQYILASKASPHWWVGQKTCHCHTCLKNHGQLCKMCSKHEFWTNVGEKLYVKNQDGAQICEPWNGWSTAIIFCFVFWLEIFVIWKLLVLQIYAQFILALSTQY